MKERSASHVSLRVSDIDRSTRFYTEFLGGRVVMDISFDADYIESVFGAPPGTAAQMRFIVFDDITVEIWEFRPGPPIPATDQTSVGLMHFCLMVEDVVGTVRRVESAGGRAPFPIRQFGPSGHFVYIEDPDGNVVELLDITLEECLAQLDEGTLPDVTV